MTASRLALVTGANQGLGFALVAGLAARMNPDDLVLLTGRNAERVGAATAAVAGDPRSRSRVEGRVLDVTDAGAVARLAAALASRHGGADIVISNAIGPLTPDRPQSEQADEFIAVANGGTHAMLRSFGPALRPGGRLIVVASTLGTLGHLDPRLHSLLDGVSLEEVEAAVESWRTAIHDGTAEERGWPRWINVPSKVAQVAAVRAVAARRRAGDLAEGTLLASVCPGMVDTGHPGHGSVTTARRRPLTRPRGPCSTWCWPTGSTRRPTVNSSGSARCCPGTAERRLATRNSCSADRQGESRGSACGAGERVLGPGPQGGRRESAYLTGDHPPVAQHQQGRDGLSFEPLRDLRRGIDVHLDQLHLARQVTGELLERGADHPAGAAPGGPEIHDDGDLGGLGHVTEGGIVGVGDPR
jgi:carbonyl reductase 1